MTAPQSPRIAFGGILTECNHLGGVPIDRATYESDILMFDDELLEQTTSVVGGMLDGLSQLGAVPLPLIYASACSGGPITHACYQWLRDEWHERLRKLLPVDGVLLPLHGAALVEGLDDPEGDLIRAARELVGPNVPVVVTLDLHAHVTEQMIRSADAILAWETYPHRDQFQTGRRAASLLGKILSGTCRPTMAMGKVPVITSAIHGSTEDDDPFADLMRYAKSLEQRDRVLSTSLFLIHPYMDCADMGSGALVLTDDDAELARALAVDIGHRYWNRRHDLEPEMVSPADAIGAGLATQGGPVILVESADCCGGGAAGDSIATLSALVDAEVDEAAFVPVVDPHAARACHHAGEATALTITLGHGLDPRWGDPREFSGHVESLSDGYFTYSGGQFDGHRAQMGPSAVFRIGQVRVLITSRATYDWADEQMRSAGFRPNDFKFIVAKNPMNYRYAYGHIAKATFVLDTPGPTPATLRHVKFEKLRRPYFPADSEIPNLEPRVISRPS